MVKDWKNTALCCQPHEESLAAAKSSKANTQTDTRGEERQRLSWHIPENII